MKLTIYENELFNSVREVREVPRMKIPFRTAEAVAVQLSELDLTDEMEMVRVVLKNVKHITAVVQATFALPDEDLPLIDVMELGELAKEIIQYVIGKMTELGDGVEDDGPNL